MTGIVVVAVALALHVEGATPNTPPTDGGRAVGIGRMWPCAVAEANRIVGRKVWTLADRKNPAKVRKMAFVTLAWHQQYRPAKSAAELAARWRNPFSKCPAWHVQKLVRASTAKGAQAREGSAQ